MRSKNTGARKALENVIHLVFLLCGIVAVGFVLVISVYLILSGLPAIRQIGLFRFLFGQVWDPTNTTTGARHREALRRDGDGSGGRGVRIRAVPCFPRSGKSHAHH